MVTDSELTDRLREFLKTADLTTTTTATVRRQLESEFDVDLSEKKQFIRDQVDQYLIELENEIKEEEEESEEEESGVKEEEEESEVEEEVMEEEKGTTKRKLPKNDKEVKKVNCGGFNKPCSLSPQLEEFIGESELARTEVVKRMWAYIREHNLQDPSNKRNILCDEKLQNLFKVISIDMFQMNKALSKHIWPLQSEEGGPVQKEKKPALKKKKPIETNDDESPPKAKKQKVGGFQALKKKKPIETNDDESPPKVKKQRVGGFLAPLQISDALAKFIGTGENELTRSDAVKRIWSYIKENNLQNPAEKKTILCDEKLKELFQVDSFNGFGVSKLLAAHLTKKNIACNETKP